MNADCVVKHLLQNPFRMRHISISGACRFVLTVALTIAAIHAAPVSKTSQAEVSPTTLNFLLCCRQNEQKG